MKMRQKDLQGEFCADNPYVQSDEGDVASATTQGRGALFYNVMLDMKKALEFVIVVFIVITQTAVAATPQVKNVKAMQQYPWGKVYISYEVVGDVAASAGSGDAPFLFVMAKDKATGRIYEATHLSGGTGVSAGTHRIIWDVEAQGVAISSTNVVFTVAYCDELYLVVDLSGGANATSYPLSYLGSVPSGGWTDTYKTTKLVLRRLAPGTYRMQNTSNVKLTKPFYIGVFEVTQKQWELVMGYNICSTTSHGKGDNYPQHYVSYAQLRGRSASWPSSSAVDSDSFMGKLRSRTGFIFDLPTEAQWEYACRAGTTTTYYWGNSMDGKYAWCSDNSNDKTHPVGSKTANAWGLYDMSGNVWEHCLDLYGTLAYGTDPKGPAWGTATGGRVIRGGCWFSDADHCTSSYRTAEDEILGAAANGFRIVRTLSN